MNRIDSVTPPAWRQPVDLPCCYEPADEGHSDPRTLQTQRRALELIARAELGSAP